MPHKLGVLIIHGMGDQEKSYADKMIKALSKYISKRDVDANKIYWEPVLWSDVLQSKQKELWDKINKSMYEEDNVLIFKKLLKIKWRWLRKFVIHYASDVIAYQQLTQKQSSKDTHIDFYSQIHEEVHNHLLSLLKKLSNSDEPLIIIAHSLGSVIMSNYIWDRQTNKDIKKFGKTEFDRMNTLVGLITYGSPLPLYTLSLKHIESIKFPPPKLVSSLNDMKKVAKWQNFYDCDDVLGYPLKPLSISYSKAVTEDIAINVGHVGKFWNPLSHSEYDNDIAFIREVGNTLVNIIK